MTTLSHYPLVSIILPVYNQDLNFIKSALLSVEKQSYQNYEIILSDDGDSLLDMLEGEFPEFLERKNICVLKNPGSKGIFSNINYALQYVSGEFIQLFSQDDVMLETFIHDQMGPMLKYPDVAMVFCSFDVIDEKGVLLTKGINYTYNQQDDKLILSADSHSLFLKYGCLPGNISPVMLRKNALQVIGPFNQDLPYAGDFEYWVRLSERYDIYYRQKTGLKVRQHKAQASQTITNRQLLQDITSVYNNLIEMIPYEERNVEVRNINRRVGVAFMHDTISGILKGQKPLSDLKVRIKDMRQFPFHPFLSLYYYIMSIPGRLLRKFS